MASQYFVDQKAQGADDSGPGSAEKPYKTISAGVKRLSPGDSLLVKAGVYRESLDIETGGSEGSPITIEAAAGEHVVITGADLAKDWMPYHNEGNKPIWVLAPFRQWQAFTYDPAAGHGREPGPQLIVDNRLMSEVHSRDTLTSASFYYDRSGDGALYLWMPAPKKSEVKTADGAHWWDSPVNLSSDNPNEHQVELSVREHAVFINEASHVTLRGFHTRYSTGNAQCALIKAYGDHLVVEDCVAEFSHGSGFSQWGGNNVFRNNITRYNGGIGAGGCLWDSLWENNLHLANTQRGHAHGWEAGGIKFVHSNRVTVRGCQFIGNDGNGLWFDWDNTELLIENNFCCDNNGCGIFMEVGAGFGSTDDDARPEVMPAYNNSKRRSTDPREPEPTIIRNNICLNQRHDGAWGAGIALQLSSKVHVLNNTVVNNGHYGIFLRYHQFDTVGHRVVENVVMNNIVANNGHCQIYVNPTPKDKPAYVARNVIDYNLFHDDATWRPEKARDKFPWASEAETYSMWGKTQFGTYAAREWACIYGYDHHSIQGDPRLACAAAHDYRLLPDSPAIGSGKATSEVTHDFFGKKRPKNRPPSAGAIEFFHDERPSLPRMPGIQA
ncbi:MAG: hypothetical protein GF418_13100 [Chitinivibrionales bacterium]|nr:hypothetical protein [Chitinivibrionales bacterium]MBD3396556.1 hypothetical protein [Chitinivibrionales bacterium]